MRDDEELEEGDDVKDLAPYNQLTRGGVIRVVEVVIVKLFSPDGKRLAVESRSQKSHRSTQDGKWSHGMLHKKSQLPCFPGGVRRPDEEVAESAARILTHELKVEVSEDNIDLDRWTETCWMVGTPPTTAQVRTVFCIRTVRATIRAYQDNYFLRHVGVSPQ